MNNISFEQAMADLETTVKRLEEGKLSLDEAINAFEHGIRLKKICEEKLSNAKMRVDQIVQEPNGNYTLQPLQDS